MLTMTNLINIKSLKASARTLSSLEKKGLIRVLKPTPKVLNTRTKTGAVDILYGTNPKFGGHCLLGVGKRNTAIEFSFHPDNEDIILLSPGAERYKPLYFVVSFLKSEKFLAALKKGRLGRKDFAAVELEYNDPETMFFTVLKDTVHCEITVPGPGQHPVFFVTEPSALNMNRIKTNRYQFKIER